MSLRKTPFVIGEYYHIYNRGILKNPIFLNEVDRIRFIKLLFVCNSSKPIIFKLVQGKALDEIERGNSLVDIGAYCLMPNHFHILLYEKVEDGISLFMQKLLTAYSMYFNKKYERKGPLFESKFNSKHIDTDDYIKWVFSYIHLNPVKLIDSNWKEDGISDLTKAESFMKDYEYSSYHDYFLGDRSEKLILNKDSFPDHFSQLNDFKYLIEEFKVQGLALD